MVRRTILFHKNCVKQYCATYYPNLAQNVSRETLYARFWPSKVCETAKMFHVKHFQKYFPAEPTQCPPQNVSRETFWGNLKAC